MASPHHRLLKEVCSLPTAPFAEQRVLDWVDAFAASRQLKRKRDRFGNRLIQVGPARGRRLVFVAHLDHPGLVASRMVDRRLLLARFHGGVLSEYLPGAKVRFFADRQIPGTIRKVTRPSDRPEFPAEVSVSVDADVPTGSPGMFDLGLGRIQGRRFVSRVCDDLAGVAAVLAAIDTLRRQPLGAPVCALLTRGEEAGFIGALAAARDGTLIHRTDRLISVECSAAQPYAPQGKGVIVRVGDRTSIFHSALTFWITSECEALAREDPTFRFQRALMPGGTCEATVFDLLGYTAAAICVPLANYHNMDRQRRRLAPESIDLGDWDTQVRLFVRLGRQAHRIDLGLRPLRRRLNQRFAAMRRFL